MTFSSQFIDIVDALCNRFGVVIDWSQENIIPYLQELAGKYISWEIATSYAWIAIAACMVIVGIIFCALEKKHNWDTIGYWIGGVLFFIAFCVIGRQVFDIIECKCLPEKTIFDYVSTKLQQY